jgi:hypothetical protein
LIATTLGCIARAQETEVSTQADYYANHLAELNAAATRRAVLEDDGCAADTSLWKRGSEVSFCAASCVSDLDCQQGIERCRIFDVEAGPADPPLLVDDAPEMVEALEADGKPSAGMCDPFFDVEGVVDAEPIAEVERVSEQAALAEAP